MPVFVDNIGEGHHLFRTADHGHLERKDALAIGLVNNMPDGAVVSTERQVFDLIRAAADEQPIHLKFYALPTVVRSAWCQEHIDRSYLGIDDLCNGTLDGLIVTGTEAQASRLPDEPYWSDLRRVVRWAGTGTSSTIWSCLAVHAAVLEIDGIDRIPLSEKCIGVFEHVHADAHPLLEGTQKMLPMPHSRWNEIPEESLRSRDYSILARSPESGVGLFAKQQDGSLFVFLQGHPEYDALSLLGEYRRDIGRYLRHESEQYPAMPRHYFRRPVRRLLSEFRERAIESRQADLLTRFPVATAALGIERTWRPAAEQVYRNWLALLRAGKQGRAT